MHGTHDEGGTTKHNWSARCQYNVTGWVSMLAYDVIPVRQHYKAGIGSYISLKRGWGWGGVVFQG